MIYIREATDQDGPAIVALIQSIWNEFPGKGMVLDTFPGLELAPRSMHSMLWVVIDDSRYADLDADGNAIVATMGCTIHLGHGMHPKGFGEIQKLYVHPDYRRQGIAERLMDLTEGWLRDHGARECGGYTDVQLKVAHDIYRRRGYRFGDARDFPDVRRVLAYKDLQQPRVGHLATVGQTYWQHQRSALWYAWRMLTGALALVAHAVFPEAFVTTGSSVVKDLHAHMTGARR